MIHPAAFKLKKKKKLFTSYPNNSQYRLDSRRKNIWEPYHIWKPYTFKLKKSAEVYSWIIHEILKFRRKREGSRVLPTQIIVIIIVCESMPIKITSRALNILNARNIERVSFLLNGHTNNFNMSTTFIKVTMYDQALSCNFFSAKTL